MSSAGPARRLARAGALAAALLAAWGPGDAVLGQGQPQAALVRVDAVRVEPLSQTVPVIGRLVARRAGDVAARVDGPVQAFEVEVGDHVDTGQVVARLDPTTLRLGLTLAASRLAEARARLETRRARVQLAKLERERQERLKRTQAAAQAAFEDARQQEIIAQAEVNEARAAVESAQAELRRGEVDLERADVKAPYDGTVTQRYVENGDYVRVGDALVRLVSDADMEVEVEVPYERIGGLAPGTEVRVSLDDGSSHRATVRAVLPEENRLTRTRTVRLVPRFNGTTLALASEQTATVHVPAGVPRNVVSVHKDAVTRRGPQALVYVVEDGKAQIRPVDLGEALGARFEVLGGLEEGDVVVVRGNERLRPGEPVTIDGSG